MSNVIELLREARRIAQRAELDPVLNRLQVALRKAFREQGKRVAKTVRHEDPDWVFRYYEVTEKTAPLFAIPIQAAAERSLALGGKHALENFGLNLSFDIKNPRAVAYLKDYGAAKVAGIDETTREYLNTLITRALDEGWSTQEMAEAIIERFEEFAVGKPQYHIESRAHLIAVTETANAYTEANLMVAQDLEAAGIPMEKKWSTVGDNRVSDGCRANEAAGWIGLSQPFPSGHQRPPRFPGCRCDLLTRRKR